MSFLAFRSIYVRQLASGVVGDFTSQERDGRKVEFEARQNAEVILLVLGIHPLLPAV